MKNMHRFPKRGVTLVEVMIVAVIVALLAMLAIPAYQKLRRNSTGKAMVVDAHNIGSAAQQIALEFPKAATTGNYLTINVAPDGTLSSSSLGSGTDAIPTDKITQFVQKVSRGTNSPITFTFGTTGGQKAFTMSHPHCGPSDVAPNSTVNSTSTLGAPVQFDEEGNAL